MEDGELVLDTIRVGDGDGVGERGGGVTDVVLTQVQECEGPVGLERVGEGAGAAGANVVLVQAQRRRIILPV